MGTVLLLGSLAACQRGPSTATAIQAGNITILDTRTDLTDRARAKQNVEDTLIRYPDINCLVGLWSYNGPAILSAVKDANKQGQVPIVCFDEEEDTLQGIADGAIHATVVQQPYEFGYQSVRILAALARGDKSVIPADKIFNIPVKIITKDNVQRFATTSSRCWNRRREPRRRDGDQIKWRFDEQPLRFRRIAMAGVRKAKPSSMSPATPDAPRHRGRAARMVETFIARSQRVSISPNDAENQIDLSTRLAR